MRAERESALPSHSPNATPHAEIRQNATEYKARNIIPTLSTVSPPCVGLCLRVCVCVCVGSFPVGGCLIDPVLRVHV